MSRADHIKELRDDPSNSTEYRKGVTFIYDMVLIASIPDHDDMPPYFRGIRDAIQIWFAGEDGGDAVQQRSQSI